MKLLKTDYWKLRALATKLDSLLSEICFEIKLMNQSQGIELQAFLYVLDPAEIPSKEKGWALSVDYNRDHVLQTVSELKDLWESLHYWYYDGNCEHLLNGKVYGMLKPKSGISLCYCRLCSKRYAKHA
jgi:hypothetical protein